MAHKIHLFAILFLAAFTMKAQDTPAAVLANSDIDLLIKTLKPLQNDLQKLGNKYENIEDPSVLQALAANEDVKAIFKKHGWTDDYYQKYFAIAQGYSAIKVEKEFENMPEDQKQMMQAYISQLNLANTSAINPKDLELVKSNYARLDEFFMSLD